MPRMRVTYGERAEWRVDALIIPVADLPVNPGPVVMGAGKETLLITYSLYLDYMSST